MFHRDVIHANIILTFRGGQHDFVKVLDFGLAKLACDGRDLNLTSTDVLASTPLYVCPEAITKSQEIDARADVYAIGAVGYFLLTGSPVFTGLSASDVCMLHMNATPRLPSARIGRPVSSDLESLLMRCLAKSPADRPNDASDVLRRLDKCTMSKLWTPDDARRWWAQSAEISSCDTQLNQSKQRPTTGIRATDRPTVAAT
jgi:serine/threonine protein kinase